MGLEMARAHSEGDAIDLQNENIADPVVERSFRGHKDAVKTVAFNPNMKQLCSGGKDGVVMVWNFRPQLRAFRYVNAKTSARSPSGRTSASPVYKVAFSPKGDLVASGGADKSIRLWVPNVIGECSALKAHTGAVRDVDFGENGNILLSASDDKTVKLWDLKQQKFLQTMSGHTNWVRSAKFNPKGGFAASGGDDKSVMIWDLQQKKAIRTLKHNTGKITSVAFFPSGDLLAGSSEDKSINVWDIRTFQLLQHYEVGSIVNEVDVHPSGDFLLSGQDDATIKVWDTREGRLFYTLQGHEGKVHTTKFSQHGDFFATGGTDMQVMVWRTNFDRSLASIRRKKAAKERRAKEAERTIPPAASEEEPRASGAESLRGSTLESSEEEPMLTIPEQHPLHYTGDSEEYDDQISPVTGTRAPEPIPASPSVLQEPPQAAPAAVIHEKSMEEKVMRALGHVVGQLDSLAEAVRSLDDRLSSVEGRLDNLEKGSRERR